MPHTSADGPAISSGMTLYMHVHMYNVYTCYNVRIHHPEGLGMRLNTYMYM